MLYVSLIIPLYNEEKCLKENFDIIERHLQTLQEPYEIILVNDGSKDNTATIIHDIMMNHSRVRSLDHGGNRGKGAAVRSGILDASGEFVIFMDADLAVPVHFIGACLKELENGAPMVMGSRHLPDSLLKIREGLFRQLFGEVFRRGTRICLGLRISDITCGLKGFKKKAAFDIFSRSRVERWGYDAEIIFLAQKLKYPIKEIPVEWYHSFNSKVRIIHDSARTLKEIFQILFLFMTKRYDLN